MPNYPLGRHGSVSKNGAVSMSVWLRKPTEDSGPEGSFHRYTWQQGAAAIQIERNFYAPVKAEREQGERAAYELIAAIPVPDDIRTGPLPEAQRWVRGAMEKDGKERFGIVDWIPYDDSGRPI